MLYTQLLGETYIVQCCLIEMNDGQQKHSEIKAKKNRIILKRTVIWIVSYYLVSVSFVSGSVVTIALLARISFSLALCSSRSHLV